MKLIDARKSAPVTNNIDIHVLLETTVTPLANAHGRLGRKLGGTGGGRLLEDPPKSEIGLRENSVLVREKTNLVFCSVFFITYPGVSCTNILI